MLKYTILVLFLAGIKLGSCRPQKNAAEAREQITNDGIKKNQIVVNGPEDAAARNKEILNNFRNPVLEYLLNKNALRNDLSDRKGVIRQIQHSQTLLIPNLMNGQDLLAGTLLNQMGDLQTNHADENVVKRDPEKAPIENFLNYVKNHETKTKEESSVSSPVLHLNKNQTEKNSLQDDLTRIKIYPAVAVLINTFSKDGMLKNSVTHYQPDFESMKNYVKEKEDLGALLIQNQTVNLEKNLNQIQKMHYSHHINNVSGNSQSQWSIQKEEKSQVQVDGETKETHEKHEQVTAQDLGQLRQGGQGGLNWPFAGYFPIVINDPFLTAYNAFTSSMYSAFSSMIEYGPEADICRSEKEHQAHKSLIAEGHQSDKTLVQEDLKREGSDEIKTETTTTAKIVDEMENIDEMKVGTEVKLIMPEDEKKMEAADPEIFDEVRLEAAKFTSPNEEEEEEQAEVKEATERKLRDLRSKRDTTNIFMKMKKGGMIDINVQEPDIKSSDLRNPQGSDLVLRKGGVAIAGPGGAATAYTGGTAIVGPYGTVYKSPKGVAIVGPYSKIVNITDDMTFLDILEMHERSKNKTTRQLFPEQTLKQTIPRKGKQGKLSIRDEPPPQEFTPYLNQFSYKTNLGINIDSKNLSKSNTEKRNSIIRLKESELIKRIEQIRNQEFRRIEQDFQTDEKELKRNETSLVFQPKSKAEAGRNGVALSTPVSHAILFPGQKASIHFEPESVASVGPGGFAHAHSDLFVTYLQQRARGDKNKRR